MFRQRVGKSFLKVVTSEKIGGSGVTSTLGTWYGGVVMGVLLCVQHVLVGATKIENAPLLRSLE